MHSPSSWFSSLSLRSPSFWFSSQTIEAPELGSSSETQAPSTEPNLRKIVLVSFAAVPMQFCWAIQMSLLYPYVRMLGVVHRWASFTALCGPFAGMLVYPLFSYYSDRCTSRYGRRRPFIAAGIICAAIGALGLMLTSVVLGVTFLMVEVLSNRFGVKKLWGIVNFILAFCLTMTLLVTKLAEHSRRYIVVEENFLVPLSPSSGITVVALIIFTMLGIPLAITYSMPFALAPTFSSTLGAGHGRVLINLAIFISQMAVCVFSGPWEAIFGSGHLPTFMVGAIAAAASGILSIILLPPC